jgi:hypothetical protein
MLVMLKPVRKLANNLANRAAHLAERAKSVLSFARPVLKGILPSLLTVKEPELERQPHKAAYNLQAELESAGMRFTEVRTPVMVYNPSTYEDRTRSLDNSDLFKGKPQIYTTSLQTSLAIYGKLKGVAEYLNAELKPLSETSGFEIPARVELTDAEKLCFQQFKLTGWFLQRPITEAKVPSRIHPDGLQALDLIAERYARALKQAGLMGIDRRRLMGMDYDPDDTAVGFPTCAPGAMAPDARAKTTAALPPPVCRPDEYLRQLLQLATRLGYSKANMMLSAYCSTRMGAFKKWLDLWYRTASGYACDYKSRGLGNRTRYVYPAAWFINLLLSPWYVQCSHARMNIMGLWHTPEDQAKYIPILQRQGKYCYAIDFTGMDTAMFPHIIQHLISALLTHGFDKWTGEFFALAYEQMGIAYPSFHADPQSVSFAEGPVRPWPSGLKLTSEFDTLYGAAVLLSALERQIPGITRRWAEGKFVFCELGDDILFTIDTKLDADRLAKDALEMWGATLKLEEDVVFLKWMLPVHPQVPKKCRLLTRFVQQTWMNEDSYVGGVGGDTPDAVMRVAMLARAQGLPDNPLFSRFWPKIAELVSSLPFMETADAKWRDIFLRSGAGVITPADAADVLAYGLKSKSYFQGLIEKAKYNAQAAWTLQFMQDGGIAVPSMAGASAMRLAFVNSLYQESSPQAVLDLIKFMKR